jgi:predicted ester cyclase
MQDNATIVRRFADEVITQGDIDSTAQFVWEDVVEKVPFPGQGPGVEGLKDVLRGMRTAFPDLIFAVLEQVAEGDKVAGRSVRVWGIVIDRLEKGRIKETRIIMDIFGMMIQLGALAPPTA